MANLSTLFGVQTWVRSEALLTLQYPHESEINFIKETDYSILSKTEDGYFIQAHDAHDLVLYLEKASLPESIQIMDRELVFTEPHTQQFQRAYLLFPPETSYKVLTETENHYKLEYTLGKTLMQCSVKKADFIAENFVLDESGKLVPQLVGKPQDAICILEFSTGFAGTGFLLYIDGQLYCYTNQHVALNMGKLSVSLIDGSSLPVGAVEIAESRDLARFKVLTEQPGLVAIAAPVLDEAVNVLGNSLGAGRVTIISGKVTGLNESGIETSAKFVSGNSGSPILNKDDAVIGVATLIEQFPNHEMIVKGSIFEDGRRVGVRMDTEDEWIEVDMALFLNRNRLILQASAFVNQLPMSMTASISDKYYRKQIEKNVTDPALKQMLRSMDRIDSITNKYTSFAKTGISQKGNAFQYSPEYASIENAYRNELIVASQEFWNSLQQKVTSKKRSIENATPYPNTTFMQQEIARIIEMLNSAKVGIDMVQHYQKERLSSMPLPKGAP